MRIACFIFGFLLGHTLFAQTLLFGEIIDAELKEPLPFVNVGIPGVGIGTVSDEEGFYLLEVPDQYLESELRFSMVGFEFKNFSINQIEGGKEKILNLSLAPQLTILEEVIVTNGKWKKKTVGNDTRSKLITAGFTSNQLGNEMAQFVRVKKRSTTLIQGFWLSIAENTIESVVLRLNIYLDKEGFPGENILKQPIYIELPNTPQTIEVDLKDYAIYVADNFYVSIEWIEDLGVEQLLFSAGVLGKPLYARSASEAKWVKQKFNIGMGVMLSQKED